MNEALVANWNKVVGPEDTVYYLGDFSFGNRDKTIWILNRLNGKKILIRGNHDRSIAACLEMGFAEVYNSLVLKFDGYILFLRHIPPQSLDISKRTYKKEFQDKEPAYYDFFLCGHVHERFRNQGKVINVGVDAWNYTPKTLKELLDGTE